MLLNENERMGTKNEWRAKTWRKRGVDEQRRVGNNKENGIDIVWHRDRGGRIGGRRSEREGGRKEEREC